MLPGLSMFITCRHATAACQPPFGAPAKSAAGETKTGRRGRNRRQRRGLRTLCLYLPPRKVAQMCRSVPIRSIEITTVEEPAATPHTPTAHPQMHAAAGVGLGCGGNRRQQGARRTVPLAHELLVGDLAAEGLHERLDVQRRRLFVRQLAHHRDLHHAQLQRQETRAQAPRRRARRGAGVTQDLRPSARVGVRAPYHVADDHARRVHQADLDTEIAD